MNEENKMYEMKIYPVENGREKFGHRYYINSLDEAIFLARTFEGKINSVIRIRLNGKLIYTFKTTEKV